MLYADMNEMLIGRDSVIFLLGIHNVNRRNKLQRLRREILADTPPALAAKWFGLSATELEAFYHGELPLTPAMAETAGSIFGTGAAPWLDMMAAWDEAHATEKAAL